MMAGSTGLEPAASAVTGQRSNQLNYDPAFGLIGLAETLGGLSGVRGIPSRTYVIVTETGPSALMRAGGGSGSIWRWSRTSLFCEARDLERGDSSRRAKEPALSERSESNGHPSIFKLTH
jgi:hypothetical protein